MEFISNVVSALLWWSFISFAASYYVNDVSLAKYGYLHKKRYSGNRSPRYMRGPSDPDVNSHFRVMKAPFMSFDEVRSWNARDRQVQRITESYKAVQERNRLIQEERKQELNEKTGSVQQHKTENKAVVEVVNIGKNKRYDPKYNSVVEKKNKQDMEIKQIHDDGGFMNRNGNIKDQYGMYRPTRQHNISEELLADIQKNVRVINARPAALSQFPTHYRWVPLPDKVKKTHRNAAVLRNVLEDISSEMMKKYGSVKRETDNVTKVQTPRTVNRENLVKYITKEFMTEHLDRAGRIGSPQLRIETRDTPYAVFYRTNPVTVYDQEEILIDTNTKDYNNDASRTKLKNSNDLMISNSKPKVSTTNLKLHKKIKNFSNKIF